MVYSLSSLLPSTPYLLAYALPLLLLSLLLTIAGSFLTVDRSRSFAPRYDTIPGSFDTPKTHKFTWMLQGGVGGLAAGYAFGVHLSTFLSLLLPSTSSSAHLGKQAFLAIWIVSCLCTAFVAGRWKYCAVSFTAIAGGATFALALCIIIHPSLLTRIVLLAIITPTLLLLALLPFPKIQRHTLRFASASLGAFSLTISTALLAHIPAWANAWERFWLKESIDWGTSKEQGLSVMFCLTLCIGIITDWLLLRKFGECPDEKWDTYLANYTANLPDRAGTFQPLRSFWDRILHPSARTVKNDILFPSTLPSLNKHYPPDADLDIYEPSKLPSPGHLKRPRSQARFQVHHLGSRRRMREVIKFKPLRAEGLSPDSDSDDDGFRKDPSASPIVLNAQPKKPWLKQRTSLTSTDATLLNEPVSQQTNDALAYPIPQRRASQTKSKSSSNHPPGPHPDDVNVADVDYDKELTRLKELGRARDLEAGSVPEYSDYEGDPGHGLGVFRTSSKRHHSVTAVPSGASTTHSTIPTSSSSTSLVPTVPLGAVPATPSLIKALDRIALAQKDAFGAQAALHPTAQPHDPPSHTSPISSSPPPERHHVFDPNFVIRKPLGGRWEQFWREVDEKAQTQH